MTRPRPPHKEGYSVSYTTYVNHKCRCEGCTDAHRLNHKKWRDKTSPEMRRRMNRRKDLRVTEQNATMPTPNKGKPWSDEDKAIALNPKLTARQAAEKLGRTMFSVKQFRADNRNG